MLLQPVLGLRAVVAQPLEYRRQGAENAFFAGVLAQTDQHDQRVGGEDRQNDRQHARPAPRRGRGERVHGA
jgi:hypothetical protein